MPRRLAAVLPLLFLPLAAACRADRVEPPRSEFLLQAGDSTYWVRTGAGGFRTRGSPIQLVNLGGRFQEVYLVDDDRSFPSALLVGQMLFRRDIVSGDSTVVFDDTLVAGIARMWSRLHPSQRPLAPDEDVSDNAELTATSELEIIDHHGPFLSFEYRAVSEVRGAPGQASARRGVIDLRTGRESALRELFGEQTSARAIAAGRALFALTLDSILASDDSRAEAAALVLGALAFDSREFGLLAQERSPAVVFTASGRAEAGGMLLGLQPIPVPAPEWWREVASTLPQPDASWPVDRWTRDGHQLLARYDARGDRASLVLRDSLGRDWPIARVPAPVWRVYWLDGVVDSTTVRALRRAFDEAATYGEEVRTAALPVEPHTFPNGTSARFASAAQQAPRAARRHPGARSGRAINHRPAQ